MRKDIWAEQMVCCRWLFLIFFVICGAYGCAYVQTESQPVSESPLASQTREGEERLITAPPAKVEESAPKRIESTRINGLPVKEKPRKNSRTIAVLKKGVPVEIKGESGSWVNISTPEGHNGWVAPAGLTGSADTAKPPVPARTSKSTKPSLKSSASPATTDPAAKVSDSTPTSPRVSDSDLPPGAPVNDSDVNPKKISDSE